MTYEAARPWAEAMKDETRERRMPPWGAVKGFGDFRNDQALSQEDIDLLAGWANGGAPEGDDGRDLPDPPKFNSPSTESQVPGKIQVERGFFSTACDATRWFRASHRAREGMDSNYRGTTRWERRAAGLVVWI